MNQLLSLLVDIVKLSYTELNDFVFKKLSTYYSLDDITYHQELESSFIYVKGTDPYMLVAHTDTVHKEPVKEILLTKSLLDPLYTSITSPQGIGGDDRNGIALIFALLDAGFRPSLLFPSGEEIGGRGSTRFTQMFDTLPNVNFIIQFDRRNNKDVTRYADDNDALLKEFATLGYVEVTGSFSDISIICPKYGISGINVSASFFNEHTLDESTDMYGLFNTFLNTKKFLESDVVNKSFTYIPKTYHKYNYDNVSLFPDFEKPVASAKTFHSLPKPDKIPTCSVCGLYGGEMFPLADGYADEHICEVCLSQDKDVFGCLFCGSVNRFDEFTPITFNTFKREVFVQCSGCLEENCLHDVLRKDKLEYLSEILLNPFKGVK